MTTDIAIIGAGPYGLSLAASLRARNVDHRIFGTPMQTWRSNMPAGMKLKSEGFASSLYDGTNDLTLAAYCQERRINYRETGLPVTLDLFCAYGLAFQKRKVPHLELKNATRIERDGHEFHIELANGESCTARNVVIATGISHYEYKPEMLAGLPAELAGHASRHPDPGVFSGKRVAVIGAGASAIDMAALLAQNGASTHLLVRGKKIAFLGAPSLHPRGFVESLRAPQSGLGPGWRSRICTDAPMFFRHLPEDFRHKVIARHLGPSAGWWTRAPVEAHVTVALRTHLAKAVLRGDELDLTLVSADGTSRTETVDHVIAATGYRPDLRRLPFLDARLRGDIAATNHIPHLSGKFETSVPGLFVTGLAAAYTFGPLLRFAYGADFTARTLTRHLTHAVKQTRRNSPTRAEPSLRKNTIAGTA